MTETVETCIGRGLAQALAGAGANVVIAARRAATGNETLALIDAEGGRAICVQTDVARRGDVEAAVRAAIASYGGLDIVVHNAASGQSSLPTKCEEIDDARWDEQYAIAIDAAFYLAQATFAHLRDTGRGRFVILSSAQALHGGAMNPIYASVKSAQRGMVKALAREWVPHNVTVNAIAPAAETDASKAYFERNPQIRERMSMKFGPIFHVGYAVPDLDKALAYWTDVMGVGPFFLERHVTGRDEEYTRVDAVCRT